ncbi:MAG TPA: two-component sensor histidine kinase [Polyangiaceae bacterium]|nr:two-component sensor histidine kinase [Polyangiaceae bacterium]
MINGLVAGSEDHSRGFKRIVRLLIWLVIVPTGLLAAMAILMLVFWEAQLNILFGILSITLVACMVTGGVLTLVFLRREANLSKLQLDFVSKVSHELRTPLTSIRMFVDMLQSEDRSPEETALCLQVLQKETTRLSERIERLLDWGRMEAGRRVYDLEPRTVREIVEASIDAFEATQVGRTHPIVVDVSDGDVTVKADRDAIVDAMVNLLSNAVKYGGDSTIVVRARADLRHVRLSVTDDGPGIPRREHNQIFQKFYRVNDLLSREVEGSGLGLAIVRHVALGHGGRVELNSEPGKGSTFTMFIPRSSGRAFALASRPPVPDTSPEPNEA